MDSRRESRSRTQNCIIVAKSDGVVNTRLHRCFCSVETKSCGSRAASSGMTKAVRPSNRGRRTSHTNITLKPSRQSSPEGRSCSFASTPRCRKRALPAMVLGRPVVPEVIMRMQRSSGPDLGRWTTAPFSSCASVAAQSPWSARVRQPATSWNLLACSGPQTAATVPLSSQISLQRTAGKCASITMSTAAACQIPSMHVA
mmetsp:Transcript_61787/g.191419  ORF Transcript_61787/g.191419 Transcript_61787/m.191419 type:complete len:200 (-) Transcript_61787:1127-1726(-)